MNFSTPLPEKATFQGASIITAEFIAVIITPDLVWNEQKGKEKKNVVKVFKNLATENHIGKCSWRANGSEIKLVRVLFDSTAWASITTDLKGKQVESFIHVQEKETVLGL